jgi:hypothetical protein
MGTAVCELRDNGRNRILAPVLFLLCHFEREDTYAMKVQIQEAQASTPEHPLWVWRVWRDGRLTQGFSPSEKEARVQAGLAEHSDHGRLRSAQRY